MKSSIFLLLVLAYTIFISLADTDLIDQTCKKTTLYDLCRSTLYSDPQTSRAADVRSLAAAAANNCLSKANDTLNQIKKLINQTTDPNLERSLAFCAELYIPVVKYSLPEAIDALCDGHYGFARYGIADARKQADACDKMLSQSPPEGFPVREMNGVVESLADVAGAIVGVLIEM